MAGTASDVRGVDTLPEPVNQPGDERQRHVDQGRIGDVAAAGIEAMTSNSPVRWPTLTIRASAASFIMWIIRSAKPAESAASVSVIPASPAHGWYSCTEPIRWTASSRTTAAGIVTHLV